MTDFFAVVVEEEYRTTNILQAQSLAELKQAIEKESPPSRGGQKFYVFKTNGIALRRLGTATRVPTTFRWSKNLIKGAY